MRKGEDHMHVAHRQQFLTAFGKPLVPSVGVALGAVPRAEGVEGGSLIAASATAIQVATEHRRAAVLDGEQHAELQPRQPGPVLFDEAVAMRADDIGHLEKWPFHFLCSFRERRIESGFGMSMVSSGLPADLK